ncbi:signal transduction protein with periplasmic or extracellular sensor domain [Pseudobacteriovorax antillogorgiicola]|uniref:histidine kinase n=1 Tax=Pseudobacteriovorax antillogorgiicola TaxID=1513793 RepID=A0A1Y6C0F8_9BACT|nr:signal transduction protein with periplasmic or extracellular sensor domain [Pseudobacteriovorax antillogorgiicola]SMF27459.1 signal transduction protein with periplasmic or extracellular sensor domain [Pseudobacteriovorax antillogorgiicola]
MLVKILIASSLLTTILTVFSFYTDYTAEMSDLNRSLHQIQEVSVPSITDNLWNLDERAISEQLSSIAKLQGIVSIAVLDEEGSVVAERGSVLETPVYLFEQRYPMVRSNETIGELRITVTKQFIFQRLARRALVFFGTQGIKTFLISFIILFIVRYYVTNHLEKIASYFEKGKFRQDKLQLQYENRVRNELDVMVDNINEMAKRVTESERELKRNLEVQRASAINSARLASLGEMAGGIAHEINNPMAIILGNLGILQKLIEEDATDQATLEHLIDKAINTCDRVNRIISGLRTYSRDADGDPFLDETLLSIIEQTLPYCRERFRDAGIELIIEPIDPRIIISCRATQISQVLVSLLNNAYDAVSEVENKWIRIAAELKGDRVQVTVSDSGHGIPHTVIDRIFDPFFTTKEVGKGTGLGLSISKNLIENHDGTFWVNPRSEHTSFLIELPARLEELDSVS